MSINKYFLEFKNIFSFENKNGITIHKIINNEDDEATIVYAIDKPIENLRYRRFKGFWYNSSIKYTNENGKTIKAEAIFLKKCSPEVLELFENILKNNLYQNFSEIIGKINQIFSNFSYKNFDTIIGYLGEALFFWKYGEKGEIEFSDERDVYDAKMNNEFYEIKTTLKNNGIFILKYLQLKTLKEKKNTNLMFVTLSLGEKFTSNEVAAFDYVDHALKNSKTFNNKWLSVEKNNELNINEYKKIFIDIDEIKFTLYSISNEKNEISKIIKEFENTSNNFPGIKEIVFKWQINPLEGWYE